MGYRIGIDTGGTFTDVALVNEENGEMYVTKIPSTPNNPSEAIIFGMEEILRKAEITEEELTFFIHGTTVATNALLEQKGARTALITTLGFKDVLQIGRQTRIKLYDFKARNPQPLVPRDLRVEVDERIRYNGEIIKPIDREQVVSVIKELKEQGVDAVAVCLLNSYINSTHEKLIKQIIMEEFPEVNVSISCEVLPEYREYERTSTTVINSYVMPKMKTYLSSLQEQLQKKGISPELYIMQSNGGIISANTAMDIPARTVLSGPAGGALTAIVIAKMTKRVNLITIDMGGTSLDTCLIENGEPHFTTVSNIGGMPIKLPMVDMHTIGSGGGSIAWIDAGGALCVGPHSAGAVPGPVCYGRGGTEPTVTDANVALGRLNPDFLLDGKMKMDVDSARRVIKDKIADPLGVSIEKAAEGILRVVNANMLRGIYVISMEKGKNPRDFSLVAFGGAGPVHAVDLAMELGCSEVIVPEYPGVTCSIGMLTADVKRDYVQTYIKNTKEVVLDEINTIFSLLEKQALTDLQAEGFPKGEITILKSMDIRYRGQSYEISIPVKSGQFSNEHLIELIHDFHNNYESLYGYCRREEEIEVVNIRLTSIGQVENVNFLNKELDYSGLNLKLTPHAYRDVYYNNSFIPTPIYNRSSLSPGSKFSGPAIIEQLDSTVVIYPNQEARIDSFGNLIIQLEYNN